MFLVSCNCAHLSPRLISKQQKPSFHPLNRRKSDVLPSPVERGCLRSLKEAHADGMTWT